MFTIGADPELFVKKNGKLIAATGLVPGDKAMPYKVEGGAVQVDGLALEFNIDPTPYKDFAAFNANITQVIRQLKDLAKKSAGAGVTFDISSWVDFDPDYYETLPDDAKQLGCDPDFNAYSGGQPNPTPSADTNRRGAAGHIHIGWGNDIPVDNPEHIENCCRVTKILDRTVGMASIIINPDTTRREHYGSAGSFRPKPYGVEYRVPDNSWIRTKAERLFIHSVLVKALDAMANGKDELIITSMNDQDIQQMINTGKNAPAGTTPLAVLKYNAHGLIGYNASAYKGW